MRTNRRLLLLAVAVAGSALMQGCASVTTGKFVPSRSENLNHSVLPAYRNESFQLRTSPATHSMMKMAQGSGGFWDHIYY